jgi:hypothetical protein
MLLYIVQFAYVWFFSIDIPFKIGQSILNFEAHWSAVSLTPPTIDQQCQWHRGVFVQSLHSCFRNVTDTAQLRSAASLALPINGRQCHCDLMLDWGRIVPDPVKMARVCHPSERWSRPPVVSGVIYTADHKKIWFGSRIRIYIRNVRIYFTKHSNLYSKLDEFESIKAKALTRGSGAQMRKPRGRKFRDMVPLKCGIWIQDKCPDPTRSGFLTLISLNYCASPLKGSEV